MTEEVKHEIKQVINDSLVEALREANLQQSKSPLNTLLMIFQIILVPALFWLLLNSVEIQKDIVLLRVQVAQANQHLVEHMESVDDAKSANVILHHSQALPDCSACHSITTVKIPASIKKKKNIITPEDIEKEKDIIIIPNPEPDGDEVK
jgi:hypothetical protein